MNYAVTLLVNVFIYFRFFNSEMCFVAEVGAFRMSFPFRMLFSLGHYRRAKKVWCCIYYRLFSSSFSYMIDIGVSLSSAVGVFCFAKDGDKKEGFTPLTVGDKLNMAIHEFLRFQAVGSIFEKKHETALTQHSPTLHCFHTSRSLIVLTYTQRIIPIALDYLYGNGNGST